MIKKIIIRVIVAVSVAFILSKFKVLNIMSVSALTSTNTPNEEVIFLNNGSTLSTQNFSEAIIAGNRFYGYTHNTSNYVDYIRYRIPVNNFQRKDFSLTFNLYNASSSYYYVEPLQVFLRDNNNVLGYCYTNNYTSLNNPTGQYVPVTSPFQNVYCPIFNTSESYVYVQVVFNKFVGQGDFNGISRVTFHDVTSDKEILQNIENNTQEQVQSQNETNDFLKDDTPVSDDSINGVLSSTDESNSPISDLVSMPLTLLQKINTGMNGSCSPFVLGSLLGSTLTLPCINLGQRLGSLWNIIDMCMSIFMAYTIGMMCIRIYNNFTTLKDNSNDVYGGDI